MSRYLKALVFAGLLLVVFFVPLQFTTGETSYSVQYDDVEGDVETSGSGIPQSMIDSADLTAVGTQDSGDKITFTLSVKGNIVLDDDTNDYNYNIYVDTDGDGGYNYEVIASSLYGSTYAMASESGGSSSKMVYDISASGNTLTLGIEKSFFGTPASWNIYAETFMTYYGDTTMTAKDWAPQQGFTSSGGSSTGSGSGGSGDSEASGSSGGSSAGMDTSVYPGDETPTDTSIDVSITSSSYNIQNLDDGSGKVKYDVLIAGKTGGVHHCLIVFVNYYDDGSRDTTFHWLGEFNEDGNEYLKSEGYSVMHFIPTSDNWRTWEYKLQGTVNPEDVEQQNGKKIVRSEIFVRAFGDENGTEWNQDRTTFIYSYPDGSSGSGEAKDTTNGNAATGGNEGNGTNTTVSVNIPGFQSPMLVSAFALVSIALYFWRRRE